MIPKIIHYCWFGRGKKSQLIEKCIESWKKYCPDYKIIEWNEDNFDININKYCIEAYNRKKWAFVSDYARLYILKEYGGIYLDTDMELINSIDSFLNKPGFIGFESEDRIAMGIIGVEKNNEWINHFLNTYDNTKFILENGELNTLPNVDKGTEIFKDLYHINLNGKYQVIDKVMEIFPVEYFYPKNFNTGYFNITEKTVGIHHYDNSWYTKFEKKVYKKKISLIKKHGIVEGEKKYNDWLYKYRFWIFYKKNGMTKCIEKVFRRIFK